jgi:hypothetical protein
METESEEPHYSFDEFRDHFRAMSTVRAYTHVRKHYGTGSVEVEVGDRHGFMETNVRVWDYFAQQYSDRVEIMCKSSKFLVAMSWLSRNAAEIRAKDGGTLIRNVDTAPEDEITVSEALLRAIYDDFIAVLPRTASVDAIVARALQYAKDGESSAS